MYRVVCDKVCTYIAGSSVCTSCDAGKFKAAAGVNTACDNCEAGKYSAAVGSTTVNTCSDCGAGKYEATAGDESVCVRGREGEVLGMKERKKARSIYVLGHLR